MQWLLFRQTKGEGEDVLVLDHVSRFPHRHLPVSLFHRLQEPLVFVSAATSTGVTATTGGQYREVVFQARYLD